MVRRELAFVLIALAFIQGACCVQVIVSGGSNGGSGSAYMDFAVSKDSAVNSKISINSADLAPSTAISGPISKFEQTHAVKDASGKSASVYVKVVNAPNGLTYRSIVLPKEGSIATQTQISAEQWLTVPKADSIKCIVASNFGAARSSKVSLEEYNNAQISGDYVTITGYYGKALNTGAYVSASQTATSGAANCIKIYGTAKDGSGTYSVYMPLKGISGGKATFTGCSETALAGTSIQVAQKEHVHGTFTAIAAYTPISGTAKAKTWTSNYGTEYDLNLLVAKGGSLTGNMGYYVKPGTTASKIQGAVNAAKSGDTINVATGTYKENIKIDKTLYIKGAGSDKTIVDGNKVGSVFAIGKIDPKSVVTLYGLAIKNGKADNGGGIYNKAKLILKSSTISGNTASFGGGIDNDGTAEISSCTISANTATWAGGIYNSGNAAVSSSTISKNSATYAGGICNSGMFMASTITITSSKIFENSATSGGGGIMNLGKTAKLSLSSSTISKNSAGSTGGGIINDGSATISSSTISENIAKIDGGGIANTGNLCISGTSQITSNVATTGYGGGIYTNTGNKVILDGAGVAIKSNKAHFPSPEMSWYKGWGVWSSSGISDIIATKNGFSPGNQVTGNTQI